MRMGGGQPPMTPGAERPLTRQVFGEPQDGKQKNKSLYRHSERYSTFQPSEYSLTCFKILTQCSLSINCGQH